MSAPTSDPRGRRAATEALIAELAGDLRPVRRAWSPRLRFAVWIAAQAAIVLAAAWILGLRPDVGEKIRQPEYAAVLALLFVTGAASALLALLAAVPGREPRRIGALLAPGVAMALLAAAFWDQPAVAEPAAAFVSHGWPCAARAIAAALVPLVALLAAVARGATFAPGLAGVLAGAAGFLVSAAVLRLACPLDERWHLLVWHLFPVVAGLAASIALGAAWLSRWRRD